MNVIKPLLVALALLAPVTAQAQAWATRAVCDASAAEIDPQVLPAARLAQLRAEAAQLANPVGRFWRLQSPEGAVSHLWGTLHSNHPLILDIPQIVIKRVTDARVVALEFNPVPPTRAALQARTTHDPYRPDSDPYIFDQSGLDPRVVGWIRDRLAALGWGSQAADRLTLASIAEILLSDPCDDFAAGIIPDQDSRIQMLGLISGARILGLEPEAAFYQYLNAPENQPTALSILALYGAALQPSYSAAGRATDFALYLQGETALAIQRERAKMATFYGPDLATIYLQRANGYLLDSRNQDFLQTALPDLQQGGVFIAIGAFHLPGEQGMIELLRRAGYTVSRIPLPGENSNALGEGNSK